MKGALHPLTIAVTLALIALPAAFAAAQDAAKEANEDGSEEKMLGEVVVSARRREETLLEVPVAVTAFTERAIENAAIDDLGDLDANVPNLTIYAARGSSSTVTAYMRGVGQSDPLWGVDPGVGVYLDDVYIARPQGALLDILDVGRLEVLRGPQGTLYGKNTLGGAIKYISKPLQPETSASIGVVFGSDAQTDLKGSFSSALGSDSVLAKLSFGSFSRAGFGENRRTRQDVSDKEILVARATLGIQASDTLSLTFSADWLDDQSGVRGAQRLNAFNAADPSRTPPLNSRYDVLNGMPNVNDTNLDGLSLTADWLLNDAWTLKSITARRSSDTDTNIDFDTLPNTIADVRAVYSDKQFSQELQALYDAGESFNGVFGLYYFNGEAGGTVFNNFFGRSFGTTNGVVDTDSIAIFGEGTYRLNDQWAITTGLRYTRETKAADVLNQAFSDISFTRVIATPADFTDEADFNALSPKISLDYTTEDGSLIYGLISRGFKSGGFNIRANVAAVPRSARPFDDESVTSFEVGAKTALLDDALYVSSSVFYNRYRDIQLSVFTAFDANGDGIDDSFFGDFTNAGRATVRGAELELAYGGNLGLNVSGNLAYLDAKYDEFLDRGVNVAANQRFTNAPRGSGALNLGYGWNAFGGTLNARVAYAHQSKVYPTTDLSEAIAQEGYGLVSGGLIWRDDEHWTVALQGSNLTDKEYRTTGYNIPVLGVLTGFYGAPRQVALHVRYEF